MLLYPDYISLVIQDYKDKRANNLLHSGLTDRSPAKLRDACLEVCNERYHPGDGRMLKEFFGDGTDKASCLKAIEHLETTKFKPLSIFLKKLSGSTDRKNIELLAWLIDFRPRPFVFNELPNPEKTTAGKGEKRKVGSSEGPKAWIEPHGGKTIKEASGKRPDRRPGKKKVRTGILILAIASVISAGIAIFWPKPPEHAKNTFTGSEKCMFWSEDRYLPISCQKHGDTLIIPLDSSLLIQFRKITKQDTITVNAIGRVWYVRYRGNYEFYTAGGFHPIDPQLRLKPLTEYIISRHVAANP